MTEKALRASAGIKAQVTRKRGRSERSEWGIGRLATAAEVARIQQLRAEGMKVRPIAEEIGISKSQVGRLVAAGAKASHNLAS